MTIANCWALAGTAWAKNVRAARAATPRTYRDVRTALQLIREEVAEPMGASYSTPLKVHNLKYERWRISN
jgi:hypothetical protein